MRGSEVESMGSGLHCRAAETRGRKGSHFQLVGRCV